MNRSTYRATSCARCWNMANHTWAGCCIRVFCVPLFRCRDEHALYVSYLLRTTTPLFRVGDVRLCGTAVLVLHKEGEARRHTNRHPNNEQNQHQATRPEIEELHPMVVRLMVVRLTSDLCGASTAHLRIYYSRWVSKRVELDEAEVIHICDGVVGRCCGTCYVSIRVSHLPCLLACTRTYLVPAVRTRAPARGKRKIHNWLKHLLLLGNMCKLCGPRAAMRLAQSEDVG